jgi:dTDP-glucose 4,6-dehydratase
LVRKLLITGGAGFIGCNFIKFWLNKYPLDKVLNLDLLTYAGNLNNLNNLEDNPNYRFVKGDICDFSLVNYIVQEFKPDFVVNFAAESHNSLAIINPTIFFKTNLLGTQNLLEVCRKNKVPRFHHISTCEVYGDLSLDSQEKFTEETPYKPNTPYNAAKASADLAVRAYHKTFGLPITISNCCNNYGPYQFPEKLIPLFVTNLLDNRKVPLYQNSSNKREWVHVLDHCKAIALILEHGKIGETYNVGTGVEKSVEEITNIILKTIDMPESMKTYVKDRPGHDRRYLLDSSKITSELGWNPEIDFELGMDQTIQWYKDNRSWWEPLKRKLIVQEEEWSNNK